MASAIAKGEAIDFDVESLTLDEGIDLIQAERVDPLLKYLRTGVFDNNTRMTYMKAYTVVVQFGDVEQNSIKMYKYYSSVLEGYCDEGLAAVKDLAGSSLIKKLAEHWEKQKILIYWMQRVFTYLDRYFTNVNNDHPKLFTKAVRIFRRKVYDVIRTAMADAAIAEIDRERDGQEVLADCLRELVEMMCTLDDAEPKIVKQKDQDTERLFWYSQSRELYKTDFEPKLLQSTSNYYQKWMAGVLAEHPSPVVVREIERRLAEEDRRFNRYLDKSSQKKMTEVAHKVLILDVTKTLVEMDSGLLYMLDNDKQDELCEMFALLRREPSMFPCMTSVIEPWIQKRCTTIVEDQANIDNPPEYIKQVLDLKKFLDDMVMICFKNEQVFQRARNSALEAVLNKDTRCAKYLASYADLELRKGIKGKSEFEVQQVVSAVVGLFAHLKDKDIFLDFYKRALSKRLLSRASISNDAEEAFISKLKVEVGQQAISKLQAMFTDMRLSDQLQTSYNELSHGGKIQGVTHEVRVLQTNAWPEKGDDANIAPCEEMSACIKAFETFYDSKHSGRKLRWTYSVSSCEVVALYLPRKYTFAVSAYQALALMMFNSSSEVTFQQMVDTTKVPYDELQRHVLSMTVSKQRLLKIGADEKKIESTSSLSLNAGYTSDKIRVAISLIKEKEKAAPEPEATETPYERKHVVDAAIVRVMKARKKLEHNRLLEEVFKQCALFQPQPSQIKSQIESLIEREFLKRDPEKRSIYIYLP
eukprot:CAMPEP_0206578284 /NCGR_PEP_ID=MMETSP0325_2-20121206/31870_1 /ASSEMBLY_ACC=CAM_ASM_000347 /TAXON_ID=2866 /ORGANISM="Crypthecodinium cohnii, Strain Seligo" /LENGTH=754 /DNA_ID=CAMNT_0054083891 /DNA_START=10 /DNA_END=2274 /DNA_ORIENTATION=-